MRIKLYRKGSGYTLEAYSNDRRARLPLATAQFDDIPTLIPKDLFRSRIMEIMSAAGHEYAKHHNVQRYTGISEGK